MRLRAHHKLFLSYSLLVAAVVVALTVGVDRSLRAPLLDQARDELLREIALGREIYDGSPEVHPDSLARHLGSITGHRVTVIEPTGRVIGDSGVEPDEVAALEDHSGRPEVRSALSDGRGVFIRESVSVGTELLYAAVLTDRGDVLRFAVGIDEIEEAVAGVRRQVLQVGAIALLLGGLFSLGFSAAVTGPLRRIQSTASAMAGGDLTRRVRSWRRDELGDLGAALDALADELQIRLGQLEDEREEMRALIDSMLEGVLAVDDEAVIVRANPAARRMFGLDREFRSARVEEVARRTAFVTLVRRAARGEALPPTELTHDDKHFLVTAAPLPRGGAVLVFLDTTELRRLEGVRRDFVANVSHELKTPLTVIRGHSETLTDDDLPPELRKRFSETLRKNADRLHEILDDLLDLSRIESGGWVPDPARVHIESVAREAWQPFGESAEERRIAFEVRVPPEAGQVKADPQAVHQVLSNLFGNAIRYTPEGGRIEIVARRKEDGWIEVEVGDTGSGIPGAHLDRVFERFYRVDPARSRAEGGTGLGLSIVRHLVERHGGQVWAESELERGTRIFFTLPGMDPGR